MGIPLGLGSFCRTTPEVLMPTPEQLDIKKQIRMIDEICFNGLKFSITISISE